MSSNEKNLNSHRSTGPKSDAGKRRSGRNALKHGLFSKQLIFKDDQDREQYEQLLQGLRKDRNPVGALEEFCVEEIAASMWKEIQCGMLEQRLLRRFRRGYAGELLGEFDSYSDPLTSLSGSDKSLPFWECKELTVRQSKSDDDNDEVKHTIVEAKLSSGLDMVHRILQASKRDRSRAIESLRVLQNDRQTPKA